MEFRRVCNRGDDEDEGEKEMKIREGGRLAADRGNESRVRVKFISMYIYNYKMHRLGKIISEVWVDATSNRTATHKPTSDKLIQSTCYFNPTQSTRLC